MPLKNDSIYQALRVITWVIFIALCIEAGALLFNFIYSVFRPVATEDLYKGLDLSELFQQSSTQYILLFSFVIALALLKAFVFFLLIRLFQRLNLVKPFSEVVADYLARIGYYTFSLGLIGWIASRYCTHLAKRGYATEPLQEYWSESAAFLMMAAVLFVITQIFRKGIELQNENEYTI